jgi:hypothetical protein
MSNLNHLMDVYLGLEEMDWVVGIPKNIIKRFKNAYEINYGFKGKDMCNKCSAMLKIDGQKYCSIYLGTCRNVNIKCTGTR